MSAPPSVAARVAEVRARIGAAAARAGRDPTSVTLVAATKTVDPIRVQEAVDAGVTDLGENRAQELLAKTDAVVAATSLAAVRWHFLGRLQRNKVRALAPWVVCWQSVDRPELGDEIARRAPAARVLVEVNLGEEPQKGGCVPAAVPALVEHLDRLGLRAEGLMTVPPHDGDPRRWFAALREQAFTLGLSELSMGMTEDFELAVEEGATLVRVGRALFGPRT